MKTIIRFTVIWILISILSCGNLYGQEQLSTPVRDNEKKVANLLSDQQKEMLKQRLLKAQAFRKDFRASISQKQKDILENPRVMPAERRKAFRASLTDQQVSMIKSQREEMKKMRDEFRTSLTPQQKMALRKTGMAKKLYGQEQISTPVMDKGKKVANLLSDQQKEILKQRLVKAQAFRKDFRASISQKQKDILENPRVIPAERRKAYRASLTDQQVSMIKSQREEIKKMRDEFRTSLTPQQKMALRKASMAKKLKYRIKRQG